MSIQLYLPSESSLFWVDTVPSDFFDPFSVLRPGYFLLNRPMESLTSSGRRPDVRVEQYTLDICSRFYFKMSNFCEPGRPSSETMDYRSVTVYDRNTCFTGGTDADSEIDCKNLSHFSELFWIIVGPRTVCRKLCVKNGILFGTHGLGVGPIPETDRLKLLENYKY